MTLHALEFDIKNLNWLHVRKKERHKVVEEVKEEANGRGLLILNGLLGLFPNLEKLKSLSF